jgi:lactate dehydrogenase-like 2-hydroxyacid dehydrogenase
MTQAIEVLQMGPLFAEIGERLAQSYRVHRYWEADRPELLLADHGAAIRAVVTGGQIGADRSLMEQLPKLEIVAVNGVGYDKVDLAAARERSVKVSNTPDVLTDDVADLAIGLAIALCRRICEGDQFLRAGLWNQGRFPLGRRFSAQRFGILGLGRIGKAIARRLEGFGAPIGYCDVQAQPVDYQRYDTLVDLAANSDVLIVAAAASDATRGLVGRQVLNALGPEGLLVNVARGSIVDEDELVAALSEERLGGAALDVFANEPAVPEALRAMAKVVVTPHMASGTTETRRAMGELVLANLEAHFDGRPLLTAVV